MRLFTLLLLCSLTPVFLSGQKLKDEKFQIEYFRLPTASLPDSMHTYSVDLAKAGDNLRDAGLTETAYASMLKLTDFKKVPTYGHVQIKVSGAKYKLSSSKATKHSEKYKDDEGNEKTRVQYSYDLKYSVPVSVVIRSHTGEVLIEKIVGTSSVSKRVGKRTISSSSVGGMYKTAAAATENYKNNADRIKKEAVDKSMRAAVAAGLDAFRSKYDLTPQKQWLLFEIPSGKKAPQAEAWLANATTAVAVAKSLKANQPLSTEADRMAGPIAFWEDQLGKYDPTDKKQKKLFYAAANNLTTAYLILEDVENAKKYAAKLTDALKMKGYEMAQLKEKVAGLEKQMALPGATTRHLQLQDRSALVPPTPPTPTTAPATAAPAPAKLMNFDTIAAYIIKEKDGDKIEGTIRLPGGRPLFKRYRSDIKFWDQDGEAVSLNPEKIHELGFGNTKLVVHGRPTGTTGLKKRASYMKVDTDAGPIRLLTLVPYYADQSPVVTEFLEIPEEDKLMPLAFTNARWINWRKSFAELFTDCPVLYAEIRVGYYKNNVKDVRKALETYKNKPCE